MGRVGGIGDVSQAALERVLELGAGTRHLDLGGEGRYPGAMNVNLERPRVGRGLIPNHVVARGEMLPFRDGSFDLVTVENAPVSIPIQREIARVLAPGGTVIGLGPRDYWLGRGPDLARVLGAAAVEHVDDGSSLLTVMTR